LYIKMFYEQNWYSFRALVLSICAAVQTAITGTADDGIPL
jgi:hypothetical protein